MKKYCPLTKEIAFARLDRRLSEEDKQVILKPKPYISCSGLLPRLEPCWGSPTDDKASLK